MHSPFTGGLSARNTPSSFEHDAQGVFQINAVQPVRYVIEEVSGLFDVENEVRIVSSELCAVACFSTCFCYYTGLACRLR